METLSLKDDRLYRNDILKPRSRRTGYQRPRLPTPETSRSSLEAHESVQTPDSMQNDTVQCVALRPLPDGQLPANHNNYRSSSSRYGSYTQRQPQSPPYEAVDEQRPSLPPLKTILGDNMSSPPRTPRISSAHLQLTPREPTYTTATYKPPSLYPNKKQKTEPLQPVPPFNSTAFVSHHSTTLQSSVFPSNLSFSASDAQHHASVAQRQSIQHPEMRRQANNPPCSFQGAPPPHHNVATTNTSRSYATRQTGRSEYIPISASSEENGTQSLFFPGYDTTTRSTPLRRASTTAFDENRTEPNEERGPRNPTQYNGCLYTSPILEDFRTRNDSRRIERIERIEQKPHPHLSEFHRGPYPDGRPSDDFSPGRYDYYYAKARKRSNLPKHSTEIMRAWFDQNIANPYPSEDQKALFATATGISLTQVSNWFINHRRRCPELRDKRVERKKL